MPSTHLSLGECAFLACVLEATARKPGNVHPGKSFDDLTYLDFVLGAGAIAPVFERITELGVGGVVLDAIRRTRRVVRSNANLGIVLLLAPLAAVPREVPLATGIANVLDALTIDDARLVYEAIRLAQPGGMGQVADQDISMEPTQSLKEVMIHAADRDSIALQYANRFRDVFEIGCAALQFAMDTGEATEEALIVCHLELMARVPDTLIARKRGRGEAEASACRAEHVLALGGLRTPEGITALHDFDRWLRAEGNSRNPGTTADLVAACLFAMLREGRMQWPSERPFASSRSSL